MKIIKTAVLGASLVVSTLAIAQKNQEQKNTKPTTEPMYNIVTTMGTIKIKLYNETPLHRDNFAKLVDKKFYDSLLFHRVISSFMIQGGDPQSKNATSDAMLGNGDAGYTLPAEILPQFYHKKGALSAARMGDDVNPQKASSGCQFYIVQGKTYTEKEIAQMETSLGNSKKQGLFQAWAQKPEHKATIDSLTSYQKNNQNEKLNALVKDVLEPAIEAEYAKNPYKMNETQRKDYSTIGGTPHLDNNYTVYGEVVEGLDLIDKIAAVEKGMQDRPKVDVRILTVRKADEAKKATITKTKK
jgi:peptidylprolyl isomerase